MEATEVFSKITYLKEGMEKLLAQGAGVSKEDIQALLDAVEAKATPEIVFNVQQLAASLAQPLAANMPALDTEGVAKLLLPTLADGMPTPDVLHKTTDEVIARLNREFHRLDKSVQAFLDFVMKRMETMEQRIDATVDRLPHTVGLNAFHDKKVLLLTLGLPTVCLLALLINSVFFRVSKSEYERMQAAYERTRVAYEQAKEDYELMNDTSYYYYQQVNSFKHKFPKTASYFPAYHKSAQARSAK